MTKGLIMRYVSKMERKVREIDTPQLAYQKRKDATERVESRNDFLNRFWKWCDRRDKLIDMYTKNPQIFKKWVACDGGASIDTVIVNILPMLIAQFME